VIGLLLQSLLERLTFQRIESSELQAIRLHSTVFASSVKQFWTSVYVGNNFTLNEAKRLLEDDKTALLGVKTKIADDTGDYIVRIKDLLKSSHFMVAKDKLTD